MQKRRSEEEKETKKFVGVVAVCSTTKIINHTHPIINKKYTHTLTTYQQHSMATNDDENTSTGPAPTNPVIAEAQAFVKAAKERRQHHHSSSLLPPQLQILEDHEAPAIEQLLGK